MEKKQITVAEAYPPGEFIQEELDARGWTQLDFAEIVGRPASVINALIKGKREITLAIAKDLSAAFGTSPQFWMNLETSYRLFADSSPLGDVSQRARLFQKAPVKEMIKRNWIAPTTDWNLLEKRLLDYLDIKSLDEQPRVFPHAAMKSSSYKEVAPAQLTWLIRARKLARGIHASRFSDSSLSRCLDQLRLLRENPEDLREVPRVLSNCGIRFIVIENIARAKIDGACFWLNDHSPVIAVAIRYDRLDHAWYVIMHELGHVKNGDGRGGDPILDINLVGDDAIPFADKPEIEKRADLFAENALVAKNEMEDWVSRVRPLFSKARIVGFARRIRVHPAIVLGQLQYRKEVEFSHSREMLVKARHFLTDVALTDGFGNVLPAKLGGGL